MKIKFAKIITLIVVIELCILLLIYILRGIFFNEEYEKENAVSSISSTAKWEHDEYDMLCCSECKARKNLNLKKTTPYCPYCGAKRDGGGNK